MSAFPKRWPEGCPPSDAVDARGKVYRVVKNEPPIGSDFLTDFETGRKPTAPPCLRCGLSVLRTAHEAVHQQKLFPGLGSLIATSTLEPSHGKTKQTGRPTHTTWWVYEDVNRAALFSIVREEE